MRENIMFAVSDGSKVPPYVILNRKTMREEQLPTGSTVRCQHKCWITDELKTNWLAVVWNTARVERVKMWDVFKGHKTPEIKSTITGSSINTDLVVIPGGDDLTTAGALFCDEQTVQRHLSSCVASASTGEDAMTQLEESRCRVGNSFSVDYHSMKAHLTRSD